MSHDVPRRCAFGRATLLVDLSGQTVQVKTPDLADLTEGLRERDGGEGTVHSRVSNCRTWN